LRIFVTRFIKEIALLFSFCSCVINRFGYRGNSGFIEWVHKYSFLSTVELCEEPLCWFFSQFFCLVLAILLSFQSCCLLLLCFLFLYLLGSLFLGYKYLTISSRSLNLLEHKFSKYF
jgi:hypothetical protein